MNLTRHIKLQVADGESMEFLLGKMRGPVLAVSQDTEMFHFEAHRSNRRGSGTGFIIED